MNPYENFERVHYHLGEFLPELEGIDLLFYGNGRLSSNIYILDNGKVLIDTGNFSELLFDYPTYYPNKTVEKVIITHAHMDHIGGLFMLLSQFKPEIYMHEVELEGVVKGKKLREIFEEMGLKDQLKPLKGNEDIKLENRTLKVLYTPGHTPGTICLYDPSNAVLFSSDVLFPMMGEWALLPAPDPQGGSVEELALSLRYLMKLNIKAFLPGHLFPVFEEPLEHMKRAYFELQLQIQKREDLAYINTGIVLADTGDIDGAIYCFDKVLEKEPKHPGACFTKGLALYQKGKLEEALEYFDKALEVYPDFKEAQQAKEMVLKMLNQG